MSILKSKRKCSQIKYNRIEPPGAALIECPGRAVRRALWQQVSTHGGRQTTDHYVHATLIVAHLGRSTVPWSKTIWLSVFRRESANQSTNQRDTTRRGSRVGSWEGHSPHMLVHKGSDHRIRTYNKKCHTRKGPKIASINK